MEENGQRMEDGCLRMEDGGLRMENIGLFFQVLSNPMAIPQKTDRASKSGPFKIQTIHWNKENGVVVQM